MIALEPRSNTMKMGVHNDTLAGALTAADYVALWRRFAEKYGEQNKALNFFFGNHSVARDRERNLNRELALNYPN